MQEKSQPLDVGGQSYRRLLAQSVARSPNLAAQFIKRSRQLLERFQQWCHLLSTLPRAQRRRLQRRVQLSVTGMALTLAISHTAVAYAATIPVTTDSPTITVDGLCSLLEAIINANDDAGTHPDCVAGSGADTITLSGNSYTLTTPYTLAAPYSGLPPISSTVTIAGAGALISRDETSVEQFNLLAIAAGGELTLTQSTITGGLAAYGAGIINYGSTTLIDSTISTNTAYYVGGGILNSGVMTLTNSTVSGNTSMSQVGGGIFNYGEITTAAHVSRVATQRHATQRHATQRHAAPQAVQLQQQILATPSGELTLIGSNVISNTAAVHGGGIFNESGTVLLTDSTVAMNTAINCCGGGIYNHLGTVTLNQSTISGNRAYNYGGGIYNKAGYVTLSGSTVITNATANAGGGIASYYGSILLENQSTVTDNFAYGDGGGIDSDGDSLTITDSSILDNQSDDDGGGIDAFSSVVTIERSHISGNIALEDGGGLDPDESILLVENSTIAQNQAGNSGGAIYFTLGALTLSNSTISDNVADLDGGGIGVITSTVTISNSTISGNTALADGGGLFAYGTSVNLSIDHSTLATNSAGDQGGGLFNHDNTNFNLSRTLMAGNTATNGGHELYNTVAITLPADSRNLLGDNSQSNAQAFTNFTPGGNDILATSDGTRPTALAAILNPILADHGGPATSAGQATFTHALVGGSPAIDAAGNSGLVADQRGTLRPQGPAADIGAFEVVEAALAPTTQLTQQPGTTQSCVAGITPYIKHCTVSFTLKNTSGGTLQINSYQLTALSSHVYVRNGNPTPGQVGTVVPGVGGVAANATFQPTFNLGLTLNNSYTVRFKVYGYVGVTAATTVDRPLADNQLVELGEFAVTLTPDETAADFQLLLPLITR